MLIKKSELSEVQKGIYFDCQIENPVSYNISAAIMLQGLDVDRFEKALRLLVSEQEMLRSSLESGENGPIFDIFDHIEFKLKQTDLSHEKSDNIKHLKSYIRSDTIKPFDLARTPLFRTRLLKTDEKTHIFVIVIHHIISDGVSLDILKNRLLENYRRLSENNEITVQTDSGFFNFVQTENEKLKNGEYENQKSYWIHKMQGAEPLALLPDFSVGHEVSGIGKVKLFEIPASIMQKLTAVAMDHECTLFMLMLSMFGILMHCYTQSEDIVLSSPFTYRPDWELENTIGCFIDTLPLCLNIKDSDSFGDILKKASREFIETYKNNGYPNNLILRDSKKESMPGSPSFFDISFVYDVYEDTGESGLGSSLIEIDDITFPGKMMVILNKTPDRDILKIQYKPDVFSADTIDLLGHRFLKLLNIMVENSNQRIGQICLLDENEKKLVLKDFNQSSYFAYVPGTIVDIFSTKAAMFPERIALICDGKTETYGSAKVKVNQLANKLIKLKKKSNDVIGIQLERSINLVISILAVLKSGCAYVPIDASYPDSRKRFILDDAGISVVITSHGLPEFDSCRTVFADDPKTFSGDDSEPYIESDPHSLAYIIYTSGSTGTPKGVMIENHSVVNTLLDLERRFPMRKNDLFMLKTAFTFDVSTTELFGWFMGEGSLFILEPGAEKFPLRILECIYKSNVTHINFVPSMFRLFLDMLDSDDKIKKLLSLKWVFLGGEPVTPDLLKKFYTLGTNINLENVYGPTEFTIWASTCPLKNYRSRGNIPIGSPLNETRMYILSRNGRLQPLGIPGEVCLSGAGIARGYLNRPDLTAKAFVKNPFYHSGTDPLYYEKMYRTGDLARRLSDGSIEFLGRIDFQVKIRGARMELGEIDNALAEFGSIIQAVTVVKKAVNKPAELCSYYLSDSEIPVADLKKHLLAILPAYMIPSFFVHKTEMPLNSSGKINRNALTADMDYLKIKSAKYVAPDTEIEKMIVRVFTDVLSIERVGIDDNFFEIGGHSLSLIQVHNKLQSMMNKEFPITLLFEYPTVRLLSDYFKSGGNDQKTIRRAYYKKDKNFARSDIAVIGLAVHVPGADDVRQFWDNLRDEKESIHFYTDNELDSLGIDPETYNNPEYVKAKGRIDGIGRFDAEFFEYAPTEVHMMSPQLRLLYQGTWEALEDAGYYPGFDKKIGLFVGGSDDFEWYQRALFGQNSFSDKYQAFTLCTNHFLATRLAYKLNINGPVYTALTGCSTSLVTPHLACQALALGDCDIAIAGGVTVETPNEGGYLYKEGMMFSPDGHCRPFDAGANGTVFSNGLGLLVLRRLTDAEKDGDHIYAVIKGSGINNDGNRKVGFFAPSVDGQADVIKEAYRNAGIDPETVGYIEAHGTGTLLGDPIEMESLKKGFATEKKQYCVLGSVKGNIGHTDTAAGAVGLVKVCLCLEHRYLPATVNFKEPNPKIDFIRSPFTIMAHGAEWESSGPRRAGINSFGVGGTNAHMVLEEYCEKEKADGKDAAYLLPFSAKSSSALFATQTRILTYLNERSSISLADAAFTLQVGRKPFKFRDVLILTDHPDLNALLIENKLRQPQNKPLFQGKCHIYFDFSEDAENCIAFISDIRQLSEKIGFARIFIRYFDHVLSELEKNDQNKIKRYLMTGEPEKSTHIGSYEELLRFACQYSLAKALISVNIVPDGFLGKGFSELSAIAAADAIELSDAVRLILVAPARVNTMREGELVNELQTRLENRDTPQSAVLNNCKTAEPKTPLFAQIESTETEYFKHINSKKQNSITIHMWDASADFDSVYTEAAASQQAKQKELYVGTEESRILKIYSLIGGLWCAGIDISWPEFSGSTARNRISLPCYVFDATVQDDAGNFTAAQSPAISSVKNGAGIDLRDNESVKKNLAEIWQEVLGYDKIMPADDFYELGGNSLSAVSLSTTIEKVFNVPMPIDEIFEHPIFSEMVDLISSSADSSHFEEIHPVGKKEYYEVSSAQKRMYAVNEFVERSSVAYNLPTLYLVEGPIDPQKIESIYLELLKRHESFRTHFCMRDGEVVQIVDDNTDSAFEFAESSNGQVENEIRKFLRPFDLSKAPLFRVKLVRLSPLKHFLFIDMHHIISDQTSIAVLMKEFSELYSGKILRPLPIQYKDFAVWQNGYLKSDKIKRQLAFFQNELSGELPKLNLQTDFDRPRIQSFEGRRILYDFSDSFSACLNKTSKKSGLTPFMLFISALNITLWKYTGQSDLIVGTGVSGRGHADLASVVGMFVNTLAIRSQINENLTVSEYFQYIKKKLLLIYDNQDCQFETLIDSLNIEKDIGRNPLFDIMINYLNMGVEDLEMENLKLKPLPLKHVDCKFDLTWTIKESHNCFSAELEYNTALFTEKSMQLFRDRLFNVLCVMIENPEQPLCALRMLTSEEEHRLIYDINTISDNYPENKTISQIFEEQVVLYQNNPAIEFYDKTYSYGELNEQANRIAGLLYDNGAKPNDHVAILFEKGPMQIISIFGILKAGCSYVPIDPAFPNERISFILKDSASRLLLTQKDFLPRIPEGTKVFTVNCCSSPCDFCKDCPISFDRHPAGSSPADTAYIMYTSGSTGTPKGAILSNRNVLHASIQTNFVDIHSGDRMLQLSNYVFDGSVFDIFGALLNGACLVLIKKSDALEMSRLTKIIVQKKITVFFITAALFNTLVDWDVTCLQNVRKVLFGGEAASVAHVYKAFRYLGPNRLVNGYGPTETCVFAACYTVNELDKNAKSIPIGHPLSDSKLYVLDKQGHPVPSYVPGELYIGGAGVGKGYLNRDELNLERFISLPFEGVGRVYRTGDRVIRLDSGALIFLGRDDFQIKMRGYRVEPGEIENYIKDISGVQDAVVIASKDKSGSIYLAAYYIAAGKAFQGIKPAEIKKALAGRIPDFMIPSRIMELESLPVNISGKLDRSALPDIIEYSGANSEYAAPTNRLEKLIVEKMQDILGGRIGIKDNFFSCGGQSIKAIALAQALLKDGIDIKVNEIFQYATAEELARLPHLSSFPENEVSLGAAPTTEPSDCEIFINEAQLDSLTEQALFTCSLISRLVTSAPRAASFCPCPIQTVHLMLGSNSSGFTEKVKGNLTMPSIKKLVTGIIDSNELMHCYLCSEKEPLWIKADISGILSLIETNIPYIDLRMFDQEIREHIIQKMTNSILLSPYQDGTLPWRICCLRFDGDTHLLILGVNHIAFDGMSADVIRCQIQEEAAALSDTGDISSCRLTSRGRIQCYSDYAALLRNGPSGISEKAIIQAFGLKEFDPFNRLFMEKLSLIPERDTKEINLMLPLCENTVENAWSISFRKAIRLLREYIGMETLPIGIVDYGRSYGDSDFYNCVGEFLDIIPICVGKGDHETYMTGLFEKCRIHSINFLSLYFDRTLSEKFPEIHKILENSFRPDNSLSNLVLFNFQGFIPYDLQNAFKNSEGIMEENRLARVMITANYDEEHINLRIECQDGLNSDRINKIIDSFKADESKATLREF